MTQKLLAMDTIDRYSPTMRPNSRQVMYQTWSQLTFLHWEVDPEPLAAMLPPGLTLDTFDGKAYVGLVPFTMTGVRPKGFPSVSWLSNFHETNVRTYVHANHHDPGVWFFSLDAANSIAVTIARKWFHLPYYYSQMSLNTDPHGWTTYTSCRRWHGTSSAVCNVTSRPVGQIEPAQQGSLEFFLAERYVLYSMKRGRLMKGRVHHRPYPLQRAECSVCEETLLSASNIVRPQEPPPLCHYASGVTVDVFPLEPVF